MSLKIMWFRKDLRFADNTAFNKLIEQSGENDQLACVFQLNPEQFLENSFNHDSFFTSLQEFRNTAYKRKIPIHFLFGEPVASFKALKAAYPKWQALYFNRDERGFGLERDRNVMTYLEEQQIDIHSYQDSHLHGAKEIEKPTGGNYHIFTPYYKKWLLRSKRPYQQTPKIQRVFQQLSDPLFVEGAKAFQKVMKEVRLPFEYVCGEAAAAAYLAQFISEGLANYEKNRDYPSIDGTSKLSQFLRTGELSIRQVWQAVTSQPNTEGQQTFIKELCWRDFYNMIYYEYPNQKSKEIKESFQELSWHYDQKQFKCWQEGRTGYPIVDAAMRQLNQTGWMHNRLRMITASFLTKDLLIDWRLGEAYFQLQLIDYDAASNIGGWQWAASTGTDAVPYFRIFNPTLQSKRFDPDGTFIKKYVPELRNVPSAYIHDPSTMPKVQREALQLDYPEPIVDHDQQRVRILAFYKEFS
ncbi:deoxyribodipyrimidine photo-lyase [Erwinia sp. CPCC 100877]|nr:deoxyribodipyrimidine photo-lyase [Erwinia sp. CPCC 100877]